MTGGMTLAILEWSLLAAQVMVVLAMGCAAFRLLWGPRAQDRVLALDTMYVNGAILLLVFGIRTGSTAYFEAALIMALLGFVATAALAKFLMRGEVIE
jgi:multicomponent K+:H+ antiporter subunit F